MWLWIIVILAVVVGGLLWLNSRRGKGEETAEENPTESPAEPSEATPESTPLSESFETPETPPAAEPEASQEEPAAEDEEGKPIM